MNVPVSDPTISVIVPMLDEESEIEHCLRSALGERNCEVIVVDGGSLDTSPNIARGLGAKVIEASRGRAIQMNFGAKHAKGEILLFLHADTRLPVGFGDEIRSILSSSETSLGAFRHTTESKRLRVRFFSATVNWRCQLGGVPYGDQGMFCRRRDFEALGGYPELDLFEDMELARALKGRGRFCLAKSSVMTSARRWEKWGVWRTYFVNKLVLIGRRFGVSNERLGDLYRRGFVRGAMGESTKPLGEPNENDGDMEGSYCKRADS